MILILHHLRHLAKLEGHIILQLHRDLYSVKAEYIVKVGAGPGTGYVRNE